MPEDKQSLVLEKVPGLMVASGLRCCGGRWEDYLQLLTSSTESYTQRLGALCQALAEGNTSEIRLQIHALAGGLGFLGAEGLSKTAAELEASLRGITTPAEPGLAPFVAALDHFLIGLKNALGELAVREDQ